MIVAVLSVSPHRQVGAVLTERKGADALDFVRLAADEVEQAEVTLDGLVRLGERLALGVGLADREGEPLAVAGEGRPAALLEDLRRVGRDDAQPELAGAVVPADGVGHPAAVGGEDVGTQPLPFAPVRLGRQTRARGRFGSHCLVAVGIDARCVEGGARGGLLRERKRLACRGDREKEQDREGEEAQHGGRCR